jgi:hypothetical protein
MNSLSLFFEEENHYQTFMFIFKQFEEKNDILFNSHIINFYEVFFINYFRLINFLENEKPDVCFSYISCVKKMLKTYELKCYSKTFFDEKLYQEKPIRTLLIFGLTKYKSFALYENVISKLKTEEEKQIILEEIKDMLNECKKLNFESENYKKETINIFSDLISRF